jgi:hypothetical protein
VCWSIKSDARFDPDVLVRFGIDPAALPQNAPKTALRKALIELRREYRFDIPEDAPDQQARARHETFRATAEDISMALTRSVTEGENFRVATLMTATIAKDGSSLSFEQKEIEPGLYNELCDKIRTLVARGRVEINGDQFSKVIGKFVKGSYGCNGVSVRIYSGGVYFVPEVFAERLAKVKALFHALPVGIRFSSFPVYDDAESMAEVEWGASAALTGEVDALFAELEEMAREGGIPKRVFERRTEDIEEIRGRLDVYREHMQATADQLFTKLSNVERLIDQRLNAVTGKVIEPFDFAAEMEAIIATEGK